MYRHVCLYISLSPSFFFVAFVKPSSWSTSSKNALKHRGPQSGTFASLTMAAEPFL